MSIFEDLTKKVTTTAKTAVKKSGDIVEVTKLNMSISAEEDKIQKAYTEIGKAVYEDFKNNAEVGAAAKEICEKIKSYEESIKEIKQKILDLKRIKACPGCGTELELEIAFCPKCGAKQEIPQPKEEPAAVEEEPKEKPCPSCGVINSPDSAFCTKCGIKL
ncbi:MAG: zinc ribbon domain-containing protein [Clostridia bacterium]|nr:zinc ribbon domain-containing protein [Clostridia bacterium]